MPGQTIGRDQTKQRAASPHGCALDICDCCLSLHQLTIQTNSQPSNQPTNNRLLPSICWTIALFFDSYLAMICKQITILKSNAGRLSGPLAAGFVIKVVKIWISKIDNILVFWSAYNRIDGNLMQWGTLKAGRPAGWSAVRANWPNVHVLHEFMSLKCIAHKKAQRWQVSNKAKVIAQWLFFINNGRGRMAGEGPGHWTIGGEKYGITFRICCCRCCSGCDVWCAVWCGVAWTKFYDQKWF